MMFDTIISPSVKLNTLDYGCVVKNSHFLMDIVLSAINWLQVD